MTEEVRATIYDQILSELNGLSLNVVSNYHENMRNRENNPFLIFDNAEAKKFMALGRSIDSQLGNRLQRIIFFISRMKYGVEHVPNVVEINIVDETDKAIECNLYSIDCNLPLINQNKGFDPYRQYVYINKHSTEKQIKKDLKIKSSSNDLRQHSFTFRNVSETIIAFLRNNNQKKVPVDLLFFDFQDGELDQANAFEIKTGGNLDTKNAESNAKEVKKLSELFDFLPHHSAYFATCYGECSAAVRNDIEEIIGENSICNGINFWDKIIPSDKFTYHDFIEIYTEAFHATNLENQLASL